MGALAARLALFSLSGMIIAAAAALGQDSGVGIATHKLMGSGEVKRGVLGAKELLRGTDLLTPVDESAGFALPAQGAEPSETFEGTPSLKNAASSGHFTLLSDVFRLVPSTDSPWKHLPVFHFQFVQSGSFFIPVEQALSITGDPVWNYIVGPGRVWRENDDDGYMRASLPFALIQRNQNCTHNGVMTFLFSTSKSPRISRVFYQITQETCYPMKFNMWGMLDAEFTPETISRADELRARFTKEQSLRMPTKPIQALAEDFPGADGNLIRKAYKHPEDISRPMDSLFTIFIILRIVRDASGNIRFATKCDCPRIRSQNLYLPVLGSCASVNSMGLTFTTCGSRISCPISQAKAIGKKRRLEILRTWPRGISTRRPTKWTKTAPSTTSS